MLLFFVLKIFSAIAYSSAPYFTIKFENVNFPSEFNDNLTARSYHVEGVSFLPAWQLNLLRTKFYERDGTYEIFYKTLKANYEIEFAEINVKRKYIMLKGYLKNFVRIRSIIVKTYDSNKMENIRIFDLSKDFN